MSVDMQQGGLDEMSWKGAVAIVTGGASGIGEACVTLLSQRGAIVEIADVDARPALDITDPQAVDRYLEGIEARHGRLDLLVNSAGIVGINRPAQEVVDDEFGRLLDVNLLGTFYMCRAAYPLLRRACGAVVNVTSQAALVSLPHQSSYSATKGGVVALTRSLAIDWGADGVRVNAVAPGVVITPMTARFRESQGFVRAVERRVPLGRMLEAKEVAEAILFLGSSAASGITGATLPVDSGWTAGEPGLEW